MAFRSSTLLSNVLNKQSSMKCKEPKCQDSVKVKRVGQVMPLGWLSRYSSYS